MGRFSGEITERKHCKILQLTFYHRKTALSLNTFCPEQSRQMVLSEFSYKICNTPPLLPHGFSLAVFLQLLSGFPAPMHRLRSCTVTLPAQINGQLVLGGLVSVRTSEDMLMVALQSCVLISATQKAMSHFCITSSLNFTASERVSKVLDIPLSRIYKPYRTFPVLVTFLQMYFSPVLLFDTVFGLCI